MEVVKEDDDSSSLASTSSNFSSSLINNAAVISDFSADSSAPIMVNKMTDIFVDSFCCCIIQRADEDPFIFKENSSKYLALCHTIHVKHLSVILVYLKTICFFYWLFWLSCSNLSP
uniref:Uncharacterized protein n=1 Tax=Ditylenchus dipsaci TaxID=166011 RepID=A0A915EQ62_9BILA